MDLPSLDTLDIAPSEELSPHHLKQCLAALPAAVFCALKSRPNRVCVAGGFIRSILEGETPKDIDIFVDSEVTAREISEELRRPGKKVVETGKALTVLGYPGPLPQLIFKWVFPHPREVIAAFDFTIAQASFWWDGKTWVSRIHPDYYGHLNEMQLVFTSPKNNDSVGTFLRVLKFYRDGFAIDNENLATVLADLCMDIADEDPSLTDLKSGLLRRLPARGNGKY